MSTFSQSPAEIEQGVLAHFAVDTLAFDQTEGDADGAVRGGPGCGLANERVVPLEDGETIHNAFFDRGYR